MKNTPWENEVNKNNLTIAAFHLNSVFISLSLSYFIYCAFVLFCVVPNFFQYNKTYLLHFCSTGKETSTHFLGLWSVLQQPRGTQLCLTTVPWSGCWVQDELCPCPAWTWPLEQKASPLHCNKRRVNTGLIGFIFDRQMLQKFVSTDKQFQWRSGREL